MAHAPKALELSRESAAAMSRANKERCAELLLTIRRKMADIKDGFFVIGEALVEINNNALYRAAGHASFGAFLDDEGLMSLSQANKLVSVAELVGREDAVSLGPEKAYALTRYAQSLAVPVPISVLLKQRELVNGRSARDLSVRDLMKAAQKARSGKRRPLDAARHTAMRTAREAQAALRRRGVEAAVVTVHRTGTRFVYSVVLSEEMLRKVAHT